VGGCDGLCSNDQLCDDLPEEGNDVGVDAAEFLAFMPNGIAFNSNVEHGRNH
jgi:hypothetical protein